jgi:acyl carrier protein
MWRLASRFVRYRCFSTTREDVQVAFRDILAKFEGAKVESITEQATFKDIGLDSLDAVEALVILEEKFGVELSDNDALKVKTVKEAIDAVANSQANPKQ